MRIIGQSRSERGAKVSAKQAACRWGRRRATRATAPAEARASPTAASALGSIRPGRGRCCTTSAASSPRIRVVTPKPAEVPPPISDSTPLPPISRIRAVFATLSDAEKAEVVSIAETEGF